MIPARRGSRTRFGQRQQQRRPPGAAGGAGEPAEERAARAPRRRAASPTATTRKPSGPTVACHGSMPPSRWLEPARARPPSDGDARPPDQRRRARRRRRASATRPGPRARRRRRAAAPGGPGPSAAAAPTTAPRSSPVTTTPPGTWRSSAMPAMASVKPERLTTIGPATAMPPSDAEQRRRAAPSSGRLADGAADDACAAWPRGRRGWPAAGAAPRATG